MIAGELAARGKQGRGARGRRLLQRGRLQPARAVGLPEPVPERRRRSRPPRARSRSWPASNLGGGSTVNWMNCLRTKPWVREEWAREHGLEGLDGPDYDRHLDAVWERLKVNDRCSDLNGPHQRLTGGLREARLRLQAHHPQRRPRQLRPRERRLPRLRRPVGLQAVGTLKTYLAGRAASAAPSSSSTAAPSASSSRAGAPRESRARYADADGRRARVVVRAPQVVVACGSMESPALLLRSGIGGPAVGDYLRLHPSTAMFGVYDERPGRLVGAAAGRALGRVRETSTTATASCSSAPPPASALTAVGDALALRPPAQGADVEVRPLGRDDPADPRPRSRSRHDRPRRQRRPPLPHDRRRRTSRMFRRGARRAGAAARGRRRAGDRHASGARRRSGAAARPRRLRRAPSTTPRSTRTSTRSSRRIRWARAGWATIPQTSVAGPWGELHDTTGVWIGDASAFPTASGTNPMITIMALAHRTARARWRGVEAAHDDATNEVRGSVEGEGYAAANIDGIGRRARASARSGARSA